MNHRRARIGFAMLPLLAAASLALASPTPCTTHPKKDAAPAELKSLARVSEEDARKAALATLADPSKATVKESELEAEHGCLVYSFDIAVSGATGV